MKIGYARVSSAGQSLELQLDALAIAECDKIYREKASAASTDGRPELEKALDQLRTGDELVVTRLDRLARSVPDLYAIVYRIDQAGAGFRCIQQGSFDLEHASGKLMLGVLGAVAQFERDLLRERQAEGIAAAKAKGVYRGRKAELDRDQVLEAFERHNRSASAAAKELGCSRASIYRILGPLAELDDPPCNTTNQREREHRPMSTLTNALADFLSATAIRTFTCEELVNAAEPKIGYRPSPMAVSRIMGTRCDWRKIKIDGRVAFTRSV